MLQRCASAVGSGGNGNSFQAFGDWSSSHSESWDFDASTIIVVFNYSNTANEIAIYNPNDMTGCWLMENGQNSNRWKYRTDGNWTNGQTVTKRSITAVGPSGQGVKAIIATTMPYPTSMSS